MNIAPVDEGQQEHQGDHLQSVEHKHNHYR